MAGSSKETSHEQLVVWWTKVQKKIFYVCAAELFGPRYVLTPYHKALVVITYLMNIDENLGFLVAYHRLDQVLPDKFHRSFLEMQYCQTVF